MAREFKNLIWAVVFTLVIYLYLAYKTEAWQAQPAIEKSTAEVVAESSANTHTIKSDESATVSGKAVRLVDVNEAGSVIVSVNGRLAIVNSSEIIDGLKITVVETFYSKDKASRAATLMISEV